MKPEKPRILLTLGDPNGIGPEIILKIFNDRAFTKKYDLFAIGSNRVFELYSNKLKLKTAPVTRMESLDYQYSIVPGKISKAAGKISGEAIEKGIELCLAGKYDALVTLPISKESLNKGGYKYPGHTEMLTKLTSASSSAMILYSKKLSVSPITGHIPLSDVNKKLTIPLVLDKVKIVNNSLVKDFKIRRPRIGILSLNPHGGDGGLLGSEEINILSPAIKILKDTGFNVEGPFPSDAFFANKAYKNFDITLSAYHDQGLIPFKMISFKDGVNFTAGLKLIRTSPDHGTAFDIAGKGIADPSSTMEAIKLAARLSTNRNNGKN